MTPASTGTPERSKGRNKPVPPTPPPKNDNDTLSQSIATKAPIALLHPQVTLTCYIPTPSVGAVIGRRGSTILQIQKQAQQSPHATGGPVRVSIVGHEEKDNTENNTPSSIPYTFSDLDWSCPQWTPVVIRADPNAALHAAFQLQKLVEHMDQVVLDLPVSRQRHAALVGKRGVVLQNTSADTNVRIMVPRKDKRQDVVQLEGELTNVQVCLERILSLAAEVTTTGKKQKGAPSNNNTNAPPSPSFNETDYALSNNMVVANLPPQTKLRQIGRKTDTAIKRKKENDEWILTVLGNSDEDIQSAMLLVTKFIESNEASRPSRRSRKAPRGRNNKGGRGPANATPPAEPTSS